MRNRSLRLTTYCCMILIYSRLGGGAEPLVFAPKKVEAKEIVVFIGRVTAVNAPMDYKTSSVGSCKYKIEREYRGRFEGTEVELFGEFGNPLHMGTFDGPHERAMMESGYPVMRLLSVENRCKIESGGL